MGGGGVCINGILKTVLTRLLTKNRQSGAKSGSAAVAAAARGTLG